MSPKLFPKKNKDGSIVLTMEVSGLVEVISWVLGFGRQAEVIAPEHLRQAVAEEIAAAMGKYVGEPTQLSQEEAEERTW
jgi:predicted DNA-binding transcriptional regulator YafY